MRFFAFIGMVATCWVLTVAALPFFGHRRVSFFQTLLIALVFGTILFLFFGRKKKRPQDDVASGSLRLAVPDRHSEEAAIPSDSPEGIFRQHYKTALDGSAEAQNQLGLLYAQGIGVQQDPTEAAKWYRKAAEQGLAEAQYNLALAYDNGAGMPQDHEQAVEWYGKACAQGFAAAQYNLAVKCVNGEGISVDLSRAVRLLQSAAGQGMEEAKTTLQQLVDSQKNPASD